MGSSPAWRRAPSGLSTFTLPLYLTQQGFPLDDAWIHAVYARELARSGMLAYNPGVPATGETAPLWAFSLAGIHTLADDTATVVALTKAAGFMLHLASTVCIGLTLRRLTLNAEPIAWIASALVALHPDLVAASVSGMEVPLATLIVVAAIAVTTRPTAAGLALVGAVTIAGRPETAVFAVVFPLAFWGRQRPVLASGLSAAAACGAAVMLGVLGLRNATVSGMFLPATFHAKVSANNPLDFTLQIQGFGGLLGQLPLVNSAAVLAGLFALSVVFLCRGGTSLAARAAAGMFVAGVAFCAVSFVLVRPIDPAAFYHQRYVLPAIFAMVAALPLVAYELFRGWPRRAFHLAYGAALAVLVGLALVDAPARYRRLSNDTRNIDDVQVSFGRALATAPA